MDKHRLRRPSPALVVSLIALVVALGGTSYAAFRLPKSSVGTKQLKKNAVTTKKIKNGAVTASKLNTSGVTVPNANHATVAGSANPVAFAHVSRTGTLDTANSKNVGSVTVGTGDAAPIYCLSGIPFTPRGGQATVDSRDSTNQEWAQFGLGAGFFFTTGCPSGTQAYVATLKSAGVPASGGGPVGTPSAAGFFVELYG